MKHRRTLTRRTAIAGAGVAALLSAPPGAANAAGGGSAAEPLPVAAATELASTLSGELGGGMAGAYYDPGSGRLVVNVTDGAAVERVRRAGAEARVVRHTLAQLAAVRKELAAGAVPGTARAVDPRLNKVVVTADRTVRGEELAGLRELVEAQDGMAVLKRSKGEFKPFLVGGDAIWKPEARCSLGFNVVRNGVQHFLTAGHCAHFGETWSETHGGAPVGLTVGSRFPGQDHALVKYVPPAEHPNEVNLHGGTQPITRAADPVVGQDVLRSGSTTGTREGEVLAVDVSVTYPQGTVDGLIHTTVCAEPGDSGGPLFWDGAALGLTSGGSGDCAVGGETFHQPVVDALEAYGAEIG